VTEKAVEDLSSHHHTSFVFASVHFAASSPPNIHAMKLTKGSYYCLWIYVGGAKVAMQSRVPLKEVHLSMQWVRFSPMQLCATDCMSWSIAPQIIKVISGSHHTRPPRIRKLCLVDNVWIVFP